MAKERVEYDVVGRDVGGSKTFKDVGDAAEKAGDQIEDLGKTSADTGDQVDESGEKAKKTTKDYHGLTAEIAKTRAEMLRLATEINKTGNTDLFKDLRGQERELRKLTKTLKVIEDAGKDAGKGFVDSFAASLQGGLSTPLLGPILTTALVAAAGAAAPAIGGALGGAVLLGGAGAAAGGGLIGAWLGDPVRYGAEWQGMVDRLQGRWLRASTDFAEPLEDSLREVDRVLRDLPIERLSAVSQDFVAPLVEGAGGGITELADGFADLVEAAGPVVDEVGPKLTNLGHDVGDAMRMIGLGADGGAEALGDLVDAIGYAVKVTGVFIGGLEKAYLVEKQLLTTTHDTVTAIPLLGDAIGFVEDKLFKIESTVMTAARSLDDIGSRGAAAFYGIDQRERDALATQERLNQAWDDSRNKILGLSNATIAVAQDFATLKEEFRGGADALNLNTEKGRENQQMINDTIADLGRQRDAAIAAGGGTAEATAKANAEYDAQLRRLEDLLVQLGLDRTAAHNLMESFHNKEITVTVKVRQVGNVSIEGVNSGGDQRNRPGTANAEGGLIRGPGTGTSDDIVSRVSNGEYVVRAAAVSALGVGFLNAVNHADRNPAALAAAAPSGHSSSTGPGASVGDRGLARLIGDEIARALSRVTLRIDDRTGRIADLYRRAG